MIANFTISDEFSSKWPQMSLGLIRCSVQVNASTTELLSEIERQANDCHNRLKTNEISQLPAIHAARKAYRALGKDPARYRLSAEALLRRIVRGDALYHINNVVDCVNLLSFSNGFSIGGYDASKISGTIQLDVGRNSDEYYGLGRGVLNIESLPVLRDEIGAFGSPTSDSVRTGVTDSTSEFLMVVFDFGNEPMLNDFLDKAELVLKNNCNALEFKCLIIHNPLVK